MTLVGRGAERKGVDVGGVSCSALSGTPILQCSNVVPLVEVHLKKKFWYSFYKARTMLCLVDESFLDCAWVLQKPVKLISPLLEDESKLYCRLLFLYHRIQ